LTIGEQNVALLKPGVDESNSPCGLNLAMVVVVIQMMRPLLIQIGNFD